MPCAGDALVTMISDEYVLFCCKYPSEVFNH